MKVEKIEKAIENLDFGISIDEMKVRNGQVRACYGHTGTTIIMWDENGDAYTFEYNTEDGEIDQDTHDKVSDRCYERNSSFDLF